MLELFFLGDGLLTRRPARPSGHPVDDLSRSARLSGVFAHVLRDVAESASTRQIHPTGSLAAGSLPAHM